MPTNVPPVTFTGTGFQAPTGPAVLTGVEADIDGAFGSNLNFALTTPQGQLAQSWSAIIENAYQVQVYYSTQTDPAFAVGRMQDAIGRIYFLERNPAEPTSLSLSCSGLTGVTIPLGALVTDAFGNLYAATQSGTIGIGGTVTISFACTVTGPVAVPSSVSIYQAITGWDSVSVITGAQGVATESRSAFETRREDSVAGNSFGAIGSIIGAVAQVPGVLDYYGYNNNTSGQVTVGGVTIPAFSIYVCVAGGSPNAVGQAIFSKKGAGAPMVGNTTVTVFDSNPLYATPIPYQITYQIPTALQLLFSVNIVSSPSVPANAQQLVQQALLAAVTGQSNIVPPPPKARIGSTVYANSYLPAISALGAWAQVSSIQIGSSNTPTASIVGTVSGNTLTVTQLVSGTLAVGQSLTDGTGANLMAIGTHITAFAGGAGGTGTYLIDIAQTLGGTFQASGTGTTMTVTGMSGFIGAGMTLSNGTGVTAGTKIVTQLSGTAGGNGTWLVSQNLHLPSPQTTTASDIILASAANSSVVAVQANQIPQLVASNIAVTVS